METDYSNDARLFAEYKPPVSAEVLTEFYIYLLVAVIGACFLIWAGYVKYRERGENNQNNFMALWVIGMLAIGTSILNLTPVDFSEVNMFVVFILILVHFLVCILISEGSTSHFLFLNERKIKRQNDLIESERIQKIMNNIGR